MFGLEKFGKGMGFVRILRFCHENAIDLARISSISAAVMGSKGKGSTARFTFDILRSVSRDVGCFTSPHLYDVTERYEHAGGIIPVDKFNRYKALVLQYAARLDSEGDALGEFELLFLIALKWFDDLKPDFIVWEAGIGGRYDPVRVIRARCGVLTSVELEHTELLGGNLELIAYDKLDAVRPGGVVIVSQAVPTSLRDRLVAFAEVSGRAVQFTSDQFEIAGVHTSIGGTQFSLIDGNGQERDVRLSAMGRHQAYNAVTALLLADTLLQGTGGSIGRLLPALQQSVVPGRLERISADPDIWIDVGHTPESVRHVCSEISRLYGRGNMIAILGVSYNKSVDTIVAIVEDAFDHIFLTAAHKNGLPPERLERVIQDKNKILGTASDIRQAVADIRRITSSSGRGAVVVGGLFLAAEFAHAWRGGDPEQLGFF